MKAINLKEKFGKFQDVWSPKIIADLNNHYVKCAKFEGEFVWHVHEEADELFWVVDGSITIWIENQTHPIVLSEGELCVIPKGVRHCPMAKHNASVVLIEPKQVVNTGDVKTNLTVENLPRI